MRANNMINIGMWRAFTCVASLLLSKTSCTATALKLDASRPFSSVSRNRRSAFPCATCRRKSRFVWPHRSIALQLAASENDDENDFFGNDSRGSFFEEAERPPKRAGEADEAPETLEELEMLCTPFDEHLPKINAVTLVGRVGNDPEPRYFDDGKVVLNLSLAVRRKYHPLERKVREIRSGEEETDWFPLEFWGRDAEYVANYVEKGTRLGVTGSLTVDGWADRTTGEQRRKAKVIVRHIDILESRAEADLRKGNRDGSSGRRKYGDEDDDDDDGPMSAGTGGFFS